MEYENDTMTLEKAYTVMFKDHKDIVSVKEVCEMLNVGPKKVRALVNDGTLTAFRSKGFQITKLSVILYTLEQQGMCQTLAAQ